MTTPGIALAIYLGAALIVVPITWRAAQRKGRKMGAMKFFAARPVMLVIMLALWPFFLLWAWHDAKIPVSKGDHVIPSPEGIGDVVGKRGKVISSLRPVGKIGIGDEQYQAISLEGPIASDKEVVVVSVDGGFVRVKTDSSVGE